MTGWWKKKVEELSKGMQQKVQFVTTVVHNPKLLIFDEPFSGFDPINANLLKNEILELSSKGATIIFSTHNMASVEELCDDISLIHKSKVILEGQINEIRQKFRTNTYEVSYSGTPVNLKSIIPPDYEVVDERHNHELQYARIQSSHKVDNNLLISKLLQAIEIHSFNEVIPNMNDVFIKVVGENNLQIPN
jgi:ABC-2 type transport system ATP-binding protein